ncbi:MAG: hypothetical protein V4718_03420, partial [Pseudomonadota bacterium]
PLTFKTMLGFSIACLYQSKEAHRASLSIGGSLEPLPLPPGGRGWEACRQYLAKPVLSGYAAQD